MSLQQYRQEVKKSISHILEIIPSLASPLLQLEDLKRLQNDWTQKLTKSNFETMTQDSLDNLMIEELTYYIQMPSQVQTVGGLIEVSNCETDQKEHHNEPVDGIVARRAGRAVGRDLEHVLRKSVQQQDHAAQTGQHDQQAHRIPAEDAR